MLAGAGIVGLWPLPPGVGGATSGSSTADWPVYHGDPAGSGAGPSGLEVADLRARWTSPVLDGAIFGEPLVENGAVYVATEADTIYALSGADGHVLWSHHVGTPVPASDLPCGDISPTVGITGTPVIDPRRHEIFAVADELVGGQPMHQLVGLDLGTGSGMVAQNVDPPGATVAALLQRTGLTLDDGRVVFGYGGNYGDCSTYHGWVVSTPETGGALSTFEVDSGAQQHQGAVWMGGAAPVIDARGNVWVAIGNGSVTAAGARYDGSDSVVELSPALSPLQLFAPADWYDDNAGDRDLGSAAPALLADGLVEQAGKSQTAFLLRGSDLGGVGGELATLHAVCGSDVGGGNAVTDDVVYLPCESGVVALRATSTPPSLTVLWRAPSGAGGPPILAGGLVWSIGSEGSMYGLDPGTGSVVAQVTVGPEANHFPTPAAGDGLLLAAATDQVHAYGGVSSAPGGAAPGGAAPGGSGKPAAGHARHGGVRPAVGTGWPVGGTIALSVLAGVGAAVVLVLVLVRRRHRSRTGTDRPNRARGVETDQPIE